MAIPIIVDEDDGLVYVGLDGVADVFEIEDADDRLVRLIGQGGNDLYLVTGEDFSDFRDNVRIEELPGGGIDTIRFEGYLNYDYFELPDNVEHLIIAADGFSGEGMSLYGNELANNISTNNTYDDSIYGGAGNDTLAGGDGYDYLVGGYGNDSLIGGNGGDEYEVDSSLDIIVEAANGGYDTVYAYANYTLPANVEELYLYGSALNGAGNALDNYIQGNGNNNSISGLGGNDTVWGYNGNDVLLGGDGNDRLYGSYGNDNLQGGFGNDILDGSYGNDTVDGGEGSDELSGGDGTDVFFGGGGDDYIWDVEDNEAVSGGAGNDQIYVGAEGDVLPNLVDGGGLGDDILFLTMFGGLPAYTLPAALENVFVSDFSGEGIELIGNALANHLTGGTNDDTLRGGAGNDVLVGGEGADLMFGGAGNDSYLVDNEEDEVNETLPTDGAADTVFTEGLEAYVLPANVEHLVYAGGGFAGEGEDGSFYGRGNSLNNSITGSGGGWNELYGMGGNDTLDPLGGTGVLAGGDGNDTYIIRSGWNIRVVELAGLGSGTDVVRSSVDWRLGMNLEQLVLTGTGSIDGIGNSASNTITGNSGHNFLDGGRGNDVLIGGMGNDVYGVDSAGDIVTELAGQGTDTIVSMLPNITLALNVENLELAQGGGNTSGVGNALNNYLWGNTGRNSLDGGAGNDTLDGGRGADTLLGGLGNDVLDGGPGADSMVGGAGNDTYYRNQTGDVVNETLGGGGVDLVYSSVSYTLGAAQENLTLQGNARSGGGNELPNVIVGNGYDNTLTGLAGNDSLDGGEGNDLMTGGQGNDTYSVDESGDAIVELPGAAEGTADTVLSDAYSYTLSENIEILTLVEGGESAYVGEGNTSGNLITGNSFDNTLYGAAGNDTIHGNAGSDDIYGDEGNDSLTGGTGNDYLDGGSGNDSMAGGTGNDDYIVDGSADVVTELLNSGRDGVGLLPGAYTLAKYVLPANVEDANIMGAVLTGGLEGNTLNNLLYGDSQDNLIRGLAGNDSLFGGAGNDTLEGGDGDDVVDGGDYGDTDSLIGGLGNDLYNVYAGDILAVDSGGTNDIANLWSFNSNFMAGTLGIEQVRHFWSGYSTATLTGGAAAENFRLLDTNTDYSLIGNAGNDTVEIWVQEDDLTTGTDVEIHDLDAGNGVNPAGPGYIDSDIGDSLLINIYSGEGDIYVGNTGFEFVTITGSGGLNIIEDFDSASTHYVADAYVTGINAYDSVPNVLHLDAQAGVEAPEPLTLTLRNGSHIDLTTAGVSDLTIVSEFAGDDYNDIYLNDSASSVTITGNEALEVEANQFDSIGVEDFNGAWLQFGEGDGFGGTLFLNLDNVNTTLVLVDWNDVFATVDTASDIELWSYLGTETLYIDGAGDLNLLVRESNSSIYAANYEGDLELVIDDSSGVSVTFGEGADNVVGGDGGDTFYFGNRLDGNDHVFGGDGSDSLYATVDGYITSNPPDSFDIEDVESVYFYGGGGNDLHINAAGIRDDGNTTLYLSGGASAGLWTITNLQVNLDAGESGMAVDVEIVGDGQSVLGSDYSESIVAPEDSGDNYLEGRGGNDTLDGGGGSDEMYGGDGNDSLSGGDGDDLLADGNGTNTLVGGAGADDFLFYYALGGGSDLVTDFATGEDQLLLSTGVFTAPFAGEGLPRTLDSSNFLAQAGEGIGGGVAGDADDFLQYDTSTGNLYYDADGNGPGAAVLFATILGDGENAATLLSSDIFLVSP